MLKHLAYATAISLLLSAGVAGGALAAEAKGKLQSIDQAKHVLILDNGQHFTLGEGVSTNGLRPGSEVTVSYQEKGGQRVATGIKLDNAAGGAPGGAKMK